MVFLIVGNFIETTDPVVIATIEILGNPSLLCILGSRMFFNLKEAAERGVNVGTNWSSYSHNALASMHFNEAWAGFDWYSNLQFPLRSG